MFEITGDDIAALNDEDLRSLIGRLCEAEMRRRGLALSAVTWGGNQNAKDAGLDVRVALPPGTEISGFIPRAATGLQVKKPDMPRSEILSEMRPKPSEEIRPSIVDLASVSGAYIIVSSTGSTSDSALINRKNAMAEAMVGVPNAEKLALDFYDRSRIATWVRDHAGLIPWVRSKIGKSIPGWQAYGAWSFSPAGVDASYLTDDTARIRTGRNEDGDGVSAIVGINRMRGELREPGKVIRLVGLSGVGKTRLLEALFDDKIGEKALDPSLAVYTNIGDNPDPQPSVLASDLVAARLRAVLLIDNCPAEVHEQLSNIARSTGSTISLVTVEYDIRDDQPEGTNVYALEVSSIELIEALLKRRFKDLSTVDARTIAEFSGGNARIAIALAGTVGKDETVAGLKDIQLFERLFHQRHQKDQSLLQIGQACALVYSFNGEDITGDDAELPVLGSLIGKNLDGLYPALAELRRRDLLQARGKWRAVLPHAIANRLAATALENIPFKRIEEHILNGSSERLITSFTRRLSYLDSSKEARVIVEQWLASGGYLADIKNLSDFGKTLFNNIAPVSQEATLSAIERELPGTDRDTLNRCGHVKRVLRSLAYEAGQFERSVNLLLLFVESPDESNWSEDSSNVIESFFHIYLSGTHASCEQRLAFVDTWVGSNNPVLRGLGLRALSAMMQTGHFTSSYAFEFGARSRDYGYMPKTRVELQKWYSSVLTLAEKFALSDGPMRDAVRKAIGNEFRGLWRAGFSDDLERVARGISSNAFWRDGWIGAKQTQYYDGKSMPPAVLERLRKLEAFLRPTTLVNRVRAIVLDAKGGGLDFHDLENDDDGDIETATARLTRTINNLGRDVANDDEARKTLLPEIASGSGRIFEFGRGMALAAPNPRALWEEILTRFATAERPNELLLKGYIRGVQERDAALADTILEEAVERSEIAIWYPILEAAVVIDGNGVGRLHRALTLGKAPIRHYMPLAWSGASDPISPADFKKITDVIARKPNGQRVALEIISMRVHSLRSDRLEIPPEIVEAGRSLMASYEFPGVGEDADRADHDLGLVVRHCLRGSEGKPIASALLGKLRELSKPYGGRVSEYGDLVDALFKVQPAGALDALFSGDTRARKRSVTLIEEVSRHRKNPLKAVPDDVVIDWCKVDGAARYPWAAAIVNLFERPDDKSPHEWTSLATALLTNAPEPKAVLTEILHRANPTSFSGSIAAKLEGRATLLAKLDVGDNPELQAAIEAARAKFMKDAEAERKSENEEERGRSERFE
jgi:hypothetical protein